MKKIICFFLFAQISLIGFAQIKIGVTVSPDYDFRTLKNNDGSASNDLVKQVDDSLDVFKWGETAGINFCYYINNHFDIDLGIDYSNKGFSSVQGFYLPYGHGNVYFASGLRITDKFNEIEMPFTAHCNFGNNKLRLTVSFGLTANLLFSIKEKITIPYYYGDTSYVQIPTQQFKTINISPTISAGIEWNINEHLMLRVEPTFRYGILKITDSPVTAYLWNAGLNTGFYFTL